MRAVQASLAPFKYNNRRQRKLPRQQRLLLKLRRRELPRRPRRVTSVLLNPNWGPPFLTDSLQVLLCSGLHHLLPLATRLRYASCALLMERATPSCVARGEEQVDHCGAALRCVSG